MAKPKNPAKTGEVLANDHLRTALEQRLKDTVQNKVLPQTIDSVVAVLSEHHYNESKLPSAYEMQQLEAVVPGGAMKAIAMAEKEQDFLITETGKNNRRSFIVDILGPAFGLIALLAMIGLCVFMVIKGQAIYAAAVIGAIGVSAAIFFRPTDTAKSQKKK